MAYILLFSRVSPGQKVRVHPSLGQVGHFLKSKGQQSRLETSIPLGEEWFIVRCSQVQTETDRMLEPLVGLNTSQTKWRLAFERESVAGVVQVTFALLQYFL